MIELDTIEKRIKALQEARLLIKSRQLIDSSYSKILMSYGSGGGAPSYNQDTSIFIPEFDYRLLRIVWTPSITPVPYAELDVKTNIPLIIYDPTTYDVYPDPNSANRNDRTSWIFYANTYDSGGYTATIASQVRSTVPGVISYEVIR